MRLVAKIIGSFVLVLLLFSCKQITKRKMDYEVHGIDISRYQDRVLWDTLDQHKIHFAFVKATEGKEHVDSFYCSNWNQLGEKGIKKGAYHFFRPSISANEQFLNYSTQVSLSHGDLPPVLDFEATGNLSDDMLLQRLDSLLVHFQNHYAIKPIIYTNLKLYNAFIANNFDEYPIWIARYSDQTPLLNQGKSWTFWQYGNRGRVTGIEGDVDLNVFHGSIEELHTFGIN